jgi:hypothetical protein
MIELPLDTPEDWTRFLQRWSTEWISVATAPDTPEHRRFPAEVVDAGWLGAGPASAAAIAAAEERLGVRLPPSYRQFLAISDGWRYTTPFIDDLLPVDEVGWFRDLNTEWLEIWADGELDPDDRNVLLYDLPVDEDEGDLDVSLDLRLMARGLQISGSGDAAVLLLDPGDVGPDGEWAGYFFANWMPGLGERRPSFAALMRAEHTSFYRLEQPSGETLQALVDQTAHARRLLLDGRLDEGLPLLVQACDFGLPAARLLDAQVQLFLGDRQQARSNLDLVVPHKHPELAADDFVGREIVPLLVTEQVRDHHLTNYRTQHSDTLATLLNDRFARVDEPITFADPGFDAVARHAR